MKFIFRINRAILLILAAGLPLAIILFPENSISWESQGIIFLTGRTIYLIWVVSVVSIFSTKTWINLLSFLYIVIFPLIFSYLAFPNTGISLNYYKTGPIPEQFPYIILCFQLVWIFLFCRLLYLLHKNAPKQIGNIIPLVLFYPIGIWVLHPRIQKYLRQPKE